MTMMKRFTAAALLLCMVLTLVACGSEPAATEAPTEAPVVATEAPVQETEAPTEATEFEGYTVTVVDEEGNPIAGAMVQLCQETCFPGATNEDGVAAFALDEAEYKVSFLFLPTGYTYSTEAQEFYFESGSKDLTITLKAEG